MRCPDCQTFVSYDLDYDPEDEGLEVEVEVIEDSGELDVTVSGSVRRVLPCAECGTELKEASFDVQLETLVTPKRVVSVDEAIDAVAEWDELRTSERQDNPDRPPRYRRTYYGVEGEIFVRVEDQKNQLIAELNLEFKDDASAGSYDEI